MLKRFGLPYFIAGMVTTTLLMTGCGGGGGNTVAPPVTSTGQYQSLQFTLTTGSSYARGQQVPLTFTVKNTGTQVVNALLGQPDAEVLQNDQIVWQYSKTTGQTEGYALNALAPGQSRSYRLAWDQKDLQGSPVSPGAYTIKVWVTALSVDSTQFTPQDAENSLTASPVSVTLK